MKTKYPDAISAWGMAVTLDNERSSPGGLCGRVALCPGRRDPFLVYVLPAHPAGQQVPAELSFPGGQKVLPGCENSSYKGMRRGRATIVPGAVLSLRCSIPGVLTAARGSSVCGSDRVGDWPRHQSQETTVLRAQPRAVQFFPPHAGIFWSPLPIPNH